MHVSGARIGGTRLANIKLTSMETSKFWESSFCRGKSGVGRLWNPWTKTSVWLSLDKFSSQSIIKVDIQWSFYAPKRGYNFYRRLNHRKNYMTSITQCRLLSNFNMTTDLPLFQVQPCDSIIAVCWHGAFLPERPLPNFFLKTDVLTGQNKPFKDCCQSPVSESAAISHQKYTTRLHVSNNVSSHTVPWIAYRYTGITQRERNIQQAVKKLRRTTNTAWTYIYKSEKEQFFWWIFITVRLASHFSKPRDDYNDDESLPETTRSFDCPN